jgi:hypothetical protein
MDARGTRYTTLKELSGLLLPRRRYRRSDDDPRDGLRDERA